jgi:hypothetical protein
MTAAIAVEGEKRPDIGGNACNQVGHAVFVGAVQVTQEFIADRANLVIGVRRSGSIENLREVNPSLRCDLTR